MGGCAVILDVMALLSTDMHTFFKPEVMTGQIAYMVYSDKQR